MTLFGKGLKTYRKFNGLEYSLEDTGTYSAMMKRKEEISEKHDYKIKLIKYKRSGYKTIQYLLYIHI